MKHQKKTIKIIQSFQPVINHEAVILILGTMPGVQSLEKQQYYGNKNNAFWRIIFELFKGGGMVTYDEKINFLQKNKIALWDTLQNCERKGSLDADIVKPIANSISEFLENYKSIRYVVFNGKASEKYFFRYNKKMDGIEYISLPSTSPANARMNFSEKLKAWSVLLEKLQKLP